VTIADREGSSALLIGVDGRLLFQQRDDLPHVFDPGSISLFGGRRERHETFLECAVREVHEEIGYYLPPERFGFLGGYRGPDPSRSTGILHGEIFVVRDVLTRCLAITEGSLRAVGPNELEQIQEQLSPAARYALELL
jgi:8-oxo-dGTP diphosphatase